MGLLEGLIAQGAYRGGQYERQREDDELARRRQQQEQDERIEMMRLALMGRQEDRQAKNEEAERAYRERIAQMRAYQDQKEARRQERELRSLEGSRAAEADADRALAENRRRGVAGRNTPRPRRPLNASQLNRQNDLRGEMGTSRLGTPVNPDALNRAVFRRMVEEGAITEDQVPEGVTLEREQSRTAPRQSAPRAGRAYRPENPFQ